MKIAARVVERIIDRERRDLSEADTRGGGGGGSEDADGRREPPLVHGLALLRGVHARGARARSVRPDVHDGPKLYPREGMRGKKMTRPCRTRHHRSTGFQPS